MDYFLKTSGKRKKTKLLLTVMLIHHLRAKNRKRAAWKRKKIKIVILTLIMRLCLEYVLGFMDSCADTWAPSCNGNIVPGDQNKDNFPYEIGNIH